MVRAALAITLVVLTGEVSAQQSSRQFEIASVKVAEAPPPMSPNGLISRQPGRWRATGATLLRLVEAAYPEHASVGLIEGGPPWIRSTRFTIEGTLSDGVPAADVPKMLAQLLASRFALRTHVEQRMFDGYALKLARQDGRLGPNLVQSAPECVEAREQRQPMPTVCERFQTPSTLTESSLTFNQAPITRILDVFKAVGGLDRPVVDRTGLTGRFDMYLHYQAGFVPAANADGVSVFAALEEQMGLKLERTREAFNVLIIDAASMPTPD